MSLFSRLVGREREPAPLPYPPDSAGGLAARWVQWAASTSKLKHPIADQSGKYASRNQPADVWFLAGTFGGQANRRVVVPAGIPLFFPVFNIWEWPAAGPPTAMPDAYGRLWVDEVPAEVDLIATPTPFQVVGVALNPVTLTNRPTWTSVWGFWRRLDPLPPGRHVIRFEGGDGHRFAVGVTYEITVT